MTNNLEQLLIKYSNPSKVFPVDVSDDALNNKRCVECISCIDCSYCYRCFDCTDCKRCIGITGGNWECNLIFGIKVTDDEFFAYVKFIKETQCIDLFGTD